jgi:hypothetical protein
MLLQYTGCALAGLGSTLVPPSWCPRRSCSRNHIFVDQNENRDLISRALGAQIPNPGSVPRRAKRDIFDFSPRVGAVATVSLKHSGAGAAPEGSKNASGMPRECSSGTPWRCPGEAKMIKSSPTEFLEFAL